MPGMQFLMALALRMGRTLGELQQSLTASELMMWAEYDRYSPIGDERADLHAAQIVSAIFGAQGSKVSLDEAKLRWSLEHGETTEVTDPFSSLEAAFLAASL